VIARTLARWLETLGGARPLRMTAGWRMVALGCWWAVLFLIVYVTIGRATKFIYVDF
jgi:hypothetical protein